MRIVVKIVQGIKPSFTLIETIMRGDKKRNFDSEEILNETFFKSYFGIRIEMNNIVQHCFYSYSYNEKTN